MSPAEALAVAVLKGDMGAAMALADHLIGEVALGKAKEGDGVPESIFDHAEAIEISICPIAGRAKPKTEGKPPRWFCAGPVGLLYASGWIIHRIFVRHDPFARKINVGPFPFVDTRTFRDSLG